MQSNQVQPLIAVNFPTTPTPYQRVIRSDLGEEFWWDIARGQWLSTSLRQLTITGNNSAGIVLAGDLQMSSTSGMIFPWAIFITRWFSSTAFNETGILQLYSAGGNLVAQNFASQNTYTAEPNIILNGGSVLGAAIVGSTTGNWTKLFSQIEYRRLPFYQLAV